MLVRKDSTMHAISGSMGGFVVDIPDILTYFQIEVCKGLVVEFKELRRRRGGIRRID